MGGSPKIQGERGGENSGRNPKFEGKKPNPKLQEKREIPRNSRRKEGINFNGKQKKPQTKNIDAVRDTNIRGRKTHAIPVGENPSKFEEGKKKSHKNQGGMDTKLLKVRRKPQNTTGGKKKSTIPGGEENKFLVRETP